MGSLQAWLLWLRYAYVHGSGAVLPCPKIRKRYTQDSRKTRLPPRFSGALAFQSLLWAAKDGHITRRTAVSRSLLSTARVGVLFGRWRSAAAA